MRIGLVLPEVPQYSETFFNYKIKGLQKNGFEVIVFSNKKPERKSYFKNVSSYTVYNQKKIKQFILTSYVLLFTLMRCPRRTAKIFFLERNDGKPISESLKSIYINAHILPYKLDWIHFGYATMALKRENVAHAIGAKMGISFRGFDINIYPLKHPGSYWKIWKNVDKVHSISEYLYDNAIRLGLPPERSFYKIPPAIDIDLFKVKEDLGKISIPLRIITVGRLNWIKDYETAISSMKILKNLGINFIYKIIGTGKEMERLKFAVNQYCLEDNIIFSGKLEHNAVNNEMRNSDIYLQTSLQEGFCVSALEAQATGLLCIGSDAEGLKENIIDGVTGWIARRRDPEAFAKKIIDVMSLSIEDRIEVALNARKRVEDNFKLDDQNIKFKNFFTE